LIRTASALLLALGLSVGVSAEPPQTPKAPDAPATQPDAAAEAAKLAAEAAAMPKAVPVPTDLPVLKKTELEDGLVVEDLKIGDGYEIKADDTVVAHYHGTLKEGGKVFDSSFEKGEPASFPLSGVIPGWQKGVPGMKIGGVRRLHIPSKLGYAERGAGADIPANSDLVFIIQMEDALRFDDEKVGEGEEVGQAAVCVTAFSMKGADGKEIEAATKDKPFIWVPREHMGMQMGLTGMKVGGKRKIMIPKQMNQTAPGLPGPARENNIPLVVEVELLAVKNLMPPQPKK